MNFFSIYIYNIPAEHLNSGACFLARSLLFVKVPSCQSPNLRLISLALAAARRDFKIPLFAIPPAINGGGHRSCSAAARTAAAASCWKDGAAEHRCAAAVESRLREDSRSESLQGHLTHPRGFWRLCSYQHHPQMVSLALSFLLPFLAFVLIRSFNICK